MQKPAYELRISDWSSDVCSSDLDGFVHDPGDVGFDRRDIGVQPARDQNRAVQRHRVAFGLVMIEFLLAAIGDGDGQRMGMLAKAISLGFDQRRAAAGAGAFARFARRFMHRLGILPVDAHAGHGIAVAATSEERLRGNEWVSTCKKRWWPSHKKKK